jgi:uncharacterized membrane protein
MNGSPLLAAGSLIAGYGVVSHWLMTHHATAPWAVAVLFGPLLAAVALGAWQGRKWLLLVGCGVAALVIAAVVARGGVQDVQRMYVLQHGAIHAVLAWTFGRTLLPGRLPLITALAERVHRVFTPAMRRYTEAITRTWTLYFLVMIGISLVLYSLAPWSWWSLFCNLLTPLAVAGLFVGEHLWRYWRHPDFERVTLRGAVQAWRDHGQQAR